MSMNKNGNYFNSKFSNSGAQAFHPKRSQRFVDKSSLLKLLPGPGHYSPKDGMSRNGDYFLSQIKSNGCRTFYHTNRVTTYVSKAKKSVPGPGQY